MNEKYKKARRAHHTLNARGWSFVYKDALNSATNYCFIDTFSEHLPGYGVALLIDKTAPAARVYAFKRTENAGVPAVPAAAHAVEEIALKADAGGVAWANSIEKELNFLRGVHGVSGFESLAAS